MTSGAIRFGFLLSVLVFSAEALPNKRQHLEKDEYEDGGCGADGD